ncbi:MAG: methyltransferase domain-containing protein [Candidatus Cloacimonetes bacterium]|nr:methyltransferase domain-containing protein [Candidatus Cloacimonadota bacterium]
MKITKFIAGKISRKYLIKLSKIYCFFTSIIYRGGSYYCPICKGSFRKFLPYGAKNWRDGRLCPGCLSLERHRLLWLYIEKKTDILVENQKILHIAPEQCFYKVFRKSHNLKYITADLESPLADVKMDIIHMPFENESFDKIICNHVLEHITDDKKAMQEIYRTLKSGGLAILEVPLDFNREVTLEDEAINTPDLRKKHYWAHDHVRLYGRDYLEKLTQTGFIPVCDEIFTEFDEKEIKRMGLIKKKLLIFKKPEKSGV